MYVSASDSYSVCFRVKLVYKSPSPVPRVPSKFNTRRTVSCTVFYIFLFAAAARRRDTSGGPQRTDAFRFFRFRFCNVRRIFAGTVFFFFFFKMSKTQLMYLQRPWKTCIHTYTVYIYNLQCSDRKSNWWETPMSWEFRAFQFTRSRDPVNSKGYAEISVKNERVLPRVPPPLNPSTVYNDDLHASCVSELNLRTYSLLHKSRGKTAFIVIHTYAYSRS